MGQQTHILIVDDEKDTRLELKSFFEAKGFTCDACCDGEEAIRKFKGPYDLALIDYHLPGMNGFDVFAGLRAKQQDLAAVMITAFGSFETWGKSVEKGFVDIIPKPFDFEDLFSRIPRWVQAARSSR